MLKLSKAQIVQIIKEEAVKVKKEFLLKKELASVNKQLNELNEVRPGGEMAPGPEGYHAGQKKPVFQMKGTHKLEEEEDDLETVDAVGDESGMGDEMGGEDTAGMEVGGDDEMMIDTGEEGGDVSISKEELVSALQDLGARLNLTGVVDFDAVSDEADMDDEMGGDDIEVDIENGVEDEPGMESSDEVPGDEAPAEEMGDAPTEEPAGEESTEDTVDECNDGMNEKEQRLNEEKSRWAKLAGIIKG
jgi:hypothetical protein